MNALQQRLAAFDVSLYYLCFGTCRLPVMPTLSRLISKLGDGSLYLIIGLLLAWLEPKHGGEFLLAGLFVFAIELPVYLYLKQLIKRDRPCDRFADVTPQITPADKFSLPSGHAAAAFVFASLLAVYYPAFMMLGYTLAGLIALARVFLGVHYPTDILAGAVLGLVSAVIGLNLIDLF
ncbi:phosphatase PAP2 family protein [Amphritea sp. 2_MG-2023]|jgi:undecaprenyl-diphosphatase|uniref:phosphatase PAP2 family protein n=1 Tax=Amphritea TaxID=515417 RepID=UPI001C06C5DF|nr:MULTISPECIES: phosphatase PAP2 family protein [Amphritea]MBU2965155.1 phosphatase PAP2 family protein [Amphritea atlantica]MDO6418940.1 phosphatase PAP2 family protein [Amphritea sp. 2_MG-2023]MDX2421915.1 phosphatase PAP2 family protein [Amphritea sp.]